MGFRRNEDFWNEEDAQEYLYYYYGRDGKALTSKWASINGQWYYFNEDSIMQTVPLQLTASIIIWVRTAAEKQDGFFWKMKPMILNTLSHGSSLTIQENGLKMK